METLTESLSFSEQPIALYNSSIVPSKQEIALYEPISSGQELALQDNSSTTSAETLSTDFFQQLFTPHPLILEDRNTAMQTIEEILSEIQTVRKQIEDTWLSGPICPYQKTVQQYLGVNYICPSIEELEFPRHLTMTQAVSATNTISNHYNDVLLNHIDVMAVEAADMSFPGITSENVGHAFAILSATAEGERYIIDHEKTAKHLEFAEIVRNIPTDYIINNPLVVAYKLLGRYIEINQN